MSHQQTRVGIGVILRNQDKVLLGKRMNAHGGGHRAFPGGHLEFGESPIECAIRELKEETGLTLLNPTLGPYTNDLFTEEGKHYITLFVLGDYSPTEKIVLLEPHKCSGRDWVIRSELPDELFLPIKNLRATGFIPF